MKYLGKITDPKDLVTKEYVDGNDPLRVTYGTTLYADILAAYNAGRIVLMKKDGYDMRMTGTGTKDGHAICRFLGFMTDTYVAYATCNDADTWTSTYTQLSTKSYADSLIPVVKSVSLTATWSGNGPYTQTVTVSGYTVTANTKVDLQPDSTAIAQLVTDSVKAMYVENNNGTLTVYAIGAAPTAALTMQCELREVTT